MTADTIGARSEIRPNRSSPYARLCNFRGAAAAFPSGGGGVDTDIPSGSPALRQRGYTSDPGRPNRRVVHERRVVHRLTRQGTRKCPAPLYPCNSPDLPKMVAPEDAHAPRDASDCGYCHALRHPAAGRKGRAAVPAGGAVWARYPSDRRRPRHGWPVRSCYFAGRATRAPPCCGRASPFAAPPSQRSRRVAASRSRRSRGGHRLRASRTRSGDHGFRFDRRNSFGNSCRGRGSSPRPRSAIAKRRAGDARRHACSAER